MCTGKYPCLSLGIGGFYLKIRPHRQTSTSKLHPKLSARYYRPYLVLQKVGTVTFKLQLPEQACIHSVFHVSQLKKAIGDHPVESDLPAVLQEKTNNYQPIC